MAFVKEYISEEDKKKFRKKELTWTIDRDRKIFLITNGPDRDLLVEFKLHSFDDGKLLLKAFAKKHAHYKNPNSANPVEAIISSYKITHIFTYDKAIEDDAEQILKDAITEECAGPPNKKYPNIEVEVIFSNELGGNK